MIDENIDKKVYSNSWFSSLYNWRVRSSTTLPWHKEGSNL